VIWLGVFSLVVIVSKLAYGGSEHVLPPTIWKWFFPWTLLGAWVSMTVTAVIFLTGRTARFVFAGLSVMAVLVLLDLATRACLAVGRRELVFRCLLVVSAVMVAAGFEGGFAAGIPAQNDERRGSLQCVAGMGHADTARRAFASS